MRYESRNAECERRIFASRSQQLKTESTRKPRGRTEIEHWLTAYTAYYNDNSHLVLLTDLSEDKVDPADIKEYYQNRNRIEFTIGFLKHKFDIPHNKNVCTEIEYFTRYLSVLFYNHWVQVNTCLSPTYALPLGANHFASANQVLHAIRDAAFEIASHQMNTE